MKLAKISSNTQLITLHLVSVVKQKTEKRETNHACCLTVWLLKFSDKNKNLSLIYIKNSKVLVEVTKKRVLCVVKKIIIKKCS